jgi:hypothetical protein
VALPDGLTTKDVRPHKIGSFIHRILIKGAFLGQASCINGTSRPDVEEVVGYVQEQKVPASKPAPKPPTPSINCSGDTVNLGQTGNAQGGNCSTNTVIVEEQPPCSGCQPKPVVVPPSPKLTVSCLTHHDVFSGGQIDLEIKATFSDGTQPTLTPSDVQFWVDEGNMMDGTKHTYSDSSGTYWVQRWQAPLSTMDHVVTWHASVQGAQAPCSNDNNVVANGGW